MLPAPTPTLAPPLDLAPLTALIGNLPDPELPDLTIADLGILRAVRKSPAGRVEVEITPTYLGCPALAVIQQDIETCLLANGFTNFTVQVVLNPPWTSKNLTILGRQKLAAAGIAPPTPAPAGLKLLPIAPSPTCPHCGSPQTRPISPFGTTLCQSLWVCSSCREPFPQFKAH